jgi:two-component system cell cycle sensor histidine kinase/response regulator CckA
MNSDTGSIRILLVEDNKADINLALRSLQAQPDPFEVAQCESLADALTALSNPNCDVVLLDLNLPDSSGIETLQRIREAAPTTPIVVLTGFDNQALGIEAVKSGAQDYIVKGQFVDNVLPRTVRYAIERKRLEQQVQSSQRLEAIGRMAAGVAHDFNNLATVIEGHVSFLLEAENIPAALREDLIEIKRAAESTTALTRQLLAIGRRQTFNPRIITVNDAVAHLAAMIKGVAGRSIRVALKLDAAAGEVKVDPSQLEQVILNLVLNARDAMPEGGELEIRTAAVEIERVTDPELQKGRYVVLTVRDSGQGMIQSVKERIFEPFFSTKDAERGSGLGLAVVYAVVKQSGGAITVESEPGRGTTFQVFFPKSGESADISASPRAEIAQGDGAVATVLLVEDDAEVRALLARALTEHGYRVIPAPGGADAIAAVEREAEGIDAVVTDLAMPGMDGAELIQRLHMNTRVVCISGYEPSHFTSPAATHCASFLQKPFPPERLLRELARVLGEPKSGPTIQRQSNC